MPTRTQANQFLQQYVADPYQLHHATMVATAMEAVAQRLGEDVDRFYITGLIHDWDFDQWPETHPGQFEKLQTELGIDQEIIEAIKGHGRLTYPRLTPLAKALNACDELSGLLYAYRQMVGNYADMKISSIQKKIYKELKFAAKISREDVITGITELAGLGLTEEQFLILMRDTFAHNE